MTGARAPPRSARTWAFIAGAILLAGLLSFGVALTTGLAGGVRVPWRFPFLWEMTGALAVLALLPFLLRLMDRYPLDRATWARRLPVHVLASVLFGVAHTLLMWGSRSALYPILGWGEYDYGDMRYRFLMEYLKQAPIYAIVLSAQSVRAYAWRNREREVQAERLERQLAEARLDALRMQLEPHFLFNTLNLISGAVHEDPIRADTMIAHLSDFLRLTLREPPAQEVALRRELEFLESYLAIMRARFDRLRVDVVVPPEAASALVPHLLLQPLVENAVKHCVGIPGAGGHVLVSAARDGAALRLVVQDDGPGVPPGGGSLVGRGVGLTNTAERLARLYGEAHRLEAANAPGGGLRVLVEIPFRPAPGEGHP